MAQVGSVCGIALNARMVSGKWNECRLASAVSNSACACGLHEVLNSTLPSFAFLAAGSSPWASTPAAEKANTDATSAAMVFGVMAGPSQGDGKPQGYSCAPQKKSPAGQGPAHFCNTFGTGRLFAAGSFLPTVF